MTSITSTTFLLLVLAALSGLTVVESEYVCYPNDTVIYHNSNPTKYKSSSAKNINGVECTTGWLTVDGVDKAKVHITGCPIDISIYLSLSDRVDDSDSIVGGHALYSTVILCDQIAMAGVVRTVTQGLNPTLSTASEVAVSPTFSVSSALRLTNALGAVQISATVGDLLIWTIDIPEEYTSTLTSCNVYAGTTVGGSATKLITNGCSDDDDLVADFSASNIETSVTHFNRYYTNFWAFKFYNNDDIIIHCDIKFCPPSSTACNMSPCTRKRRAIGNDVTDIADDAGVITGTTSRVLRVYEKSNPLGLNSGVSRQSAPLWLNLVTLGVSIWLLGGV